MSLGQMNHFIEIVLFTHIKDADGFSNKQEVTQAKVRAYREGRHGSVKWANRAAFSSATDLFRFRAIPNLTVTTEMLIIDGDQRFEITSVENVKGRGMYTEVLCKEVKPSGKSNS